MNKIVNQASATTPANSKPLPLELMTTEHLHELFRDGENDLNQIIEFISNNPRLATETLLRCNNAEFGSGERTTDLFAAVTRLGCLAVYEIVAGALAREQRRAARGDTPLDLSFWRSINQLPPPTMENLADRKAAGASPY